MFGKSILSIEGALADLNRFVHERGYRSAIFNLGVLGGINLAAPISKSPRIYP